MQLRARVWLIRFSIHSPEMWSTQQLLATCTVSRALVCHTQALWHLPKHTPSMKGAKAGGLWVEVNLSQVGLWRQEDQEFRVILSYMQASLGCVRPCALKKKKKKAL